MSGSALGNPATGGEPLPEPTDAADAAPHRSLAARLGQGLLRPLLLLRPRMGGEWWLILAVVFVALGLWLRTRCFFGSVCPFWNDEANWTIQLLKTKLTAPSIRPVGFMAASKYIAKVFGPTEVALRFLPWLAGIATAIVTIPLARRLFRAPAARLLFVTVIAVHPFAIDLGKEFKPYTISLFLHVCCLWLAASYWEVGAARWLAAALGTSFVGVLFAQDIVFVYPALYLVLGLAAWRAERYRHLLGIGAGAVLTIGLLFLLYWYFWRFVSGPGGATNRRVKGLSPIWWSRGYDLFYTGRDPDESVFGWLGRKFVEVGSFSGIRRGMWSPFGPLQASGLARLADIDRAIWTLLEILGVVCLTVKRRIRELLLLLLPPLLVVVFNQLKLWPLGAFRSDLFLLVYVTAIAAAALDTRIDKAPVWRQLLPTLLLVALPLLAFERDWHRRKGSGGEFLQGVHALVEMQGEPYKGQRELLVIDGYLCVVWQYYERVHPGHRALFQDLNRRFSKQCVRPWTQPALTRAAHSLRARRKRFWLLLVRPPELAAFANGAPPGYRLLAKREIEQGQTLAVGLMRK